MIPFHFEDTVPVCRAVGAWNDTQASLRAGAGPGNVDAGRDCGNHLAAAANALAVQYLELLSSFDKVQAQAEECLCGEQEGSAVRALANYVRWEHDRTHDVQGQSWAVCPHEACREAARWTP